MDLDKFWDLIDVVDTETLDKGEGYEDLAVKPLSGTYYAK